VNVLANRPKTTTPSEEPELFAAHEANSSDGIISTCYGLIRSFENAISVEQKTNSIPRETFVHALTQIADKAFDLARDARDLTGIQRAQILDILLSVANLLDAANYRLVDRSKKSEDRQTG
jgi:hypothetical protein